MSDTDKYPNGPDDERLMTLSKRELRLIVWAYSSELRNMKIDSTHTDDYTLAEVKRLREAIEYAIVHAENHDVIRVLDEVMRND